MRDDSDGMVSCSFCSGGHDFRSRMRFFSKEQNFVANRFGRELGLSEKNRQTYAQLGSDWGLPGGDGT